MFKDADSSEMEPTVPRDTWNANWKKEGKKEGKKAREQLLQVLWAVYFQYSFISSDVYILVSSIFSNFYLLMCHFLPSPIYDFNAKNEEITDNKIFPSSQTPALYLPSRRMTACQLCNSFPFPHQDPYPRSCCILKSLSIRSLRQDAGCWEWSSSTAAWGPIWML